MRKKVNMHPNIHTFTSLEIIHMDYAINIYYIHSKTYKNTDQIRYR